MVSYHAFPIERNRKSVKNIPERLFHKKSRKNYEKKTSNTGVPTTDSSAENNSEIEETHGAVQPNESLWERAYNEINPDLKQQYEKLLNEE